MKFGFFQMPCHSPYDNPTLAFDRDLEMIERAEELGYDEVWVGEHHTGGWETIPSPDLFLAAASQRTKRIRLGTGVINLPYHHPFHIAERMAFLDHLTHGRAMLGIGPGVLPTDIKMFNIGDETRRRDMLRESLGIILKLYRETGPVTHEGNYWTIKDMELQVKPLQQPHMPIAMPSSGTGVSAELIATEGVQMMSGNFFGGTDPHNLNSQWKTIEKRARQVKKNVSRNDWRYANYLYCAETREQAIAEISQGATNQMRDYFFNLGTKRIYEEYEGQPSDEIGIEQILPKAEWIIGDPDDCARQIAEINKAAGGFGVFLNIVGEWTSQQNWNKSMELFARYVIPRFKQSTEGLIHARDRLIAFSREGTLPK